MTPQRLGQHFLKDAVWRERILRALPLPSVGAGLQPARVSGPQEERAGRRPAPTTADELWLEIGAGHGEMTRELARRVPRLIAIEVDAKLLPGLERLASELGNVRIVAGDVLALDLVRVTGGHPFHAYGSLPYYITSPILMRLFEHAERLRSVSVVVQLEVAARMTARPGRREYGYLSAVTQFYTQPEIAFKLPPGAFQPRPKVASALVRMRLPGRRAELGVPVGQQARFLEFVGHCFAHKRKTLLNNLRPHFAAARVEAALAAARLKPQARAEELSLPQFAHLFAAL
jgi:16S rRNA (adenine1518-N6/adenine1519-N6)-dimethyltransferase